MTKKGFRSHALLVATVVFLAATAVPAAATETDADELPDQLQADLESALRAEVGKLLSEKNEEGLIYKRGSFSKSFRKIGDSTFKGSFHRDTIEGDSVKTERLEVTLKSDDGVHWKVVDEEVKDTVRELHRPLYGDEEFFRFESFAIEHEGLEVTATNGTIVKDLYDGNTAGFMLWADQIRYRYTPPKEAVSQYYSVYGYYMDRAREDLEFEPRSLVLLCDPVTCDETFPSAFTGLEKVAVADLDSGLQGLYKEAGERRRETLKTNPFAGFSLGFEEDRRVLAISLNKKGDNPLLNYMHHDFKIPEAWDHNFWMISDTYEPKEVNIFVTRLAGDDVWFGPILSYYSEATRTSGVDPYELEYRPDVNSRDFEVQAVKGTIDMAIEDAELMVGDVVLRLRAKHDLDYTRFFISRERRTEEERKELRNPTMYVNSIQDEEGNEMTWVKDSPFTGMVFFPEKVAKDETFTLRMQFQSRGSIRKVNPDFSFVDRGGWLPFVSFADIINEFDLTIRVPDDYTVLGVGDKVSDNAKGGIRTTRWVTNKPVMFPSVTFGDYIADTPSFDAKKADGTVIPITVYVDKQSTRMLDGSAAWASGARGIRPKQLKSIGEQAANAINLYREVFGVDYPYARLDLVGDPIGGLFYGQAPSSLIYLGAFVFKGEGEMAAGMVSGGTQIAKFLKSVVAHEVGHQWWGSSTVNASSNNYWFVESLAEYASAIYLQEVFGVKEYQEQVDEWRHNILERDMTVSVQDASTLSTPDFNYQAAVYNKGPYAFHVLRSTFGDEKFYAYLKKLAQSLEGKEIVTRDIQKIAEQVYGVNMEWFFDQWIRGVGIPEFEFEYVTRRTEDGHWLVQGVVKQTVVVGNRKMVMDDQHYLGAVPITVTARKTKKEYRIPIRVEGAESEFAFKVPEEPLEVAFNKYGEVLAWDVKTDEED